jgi:hypothetical protein
VKINNFVPWRPLLKQLPPPRSKKLAAEIDPQATPGVHCSIPKPSAAPVVQDGGFKYRKLDRP